VKRTRQLPAVNGAKEASKEEVGQDAATEAVVQRDATG
jgi:hypothetical protein